MYSNDMGDIPVKYNEDFENLSIPRNKILIRDLDYLRVPLTNSFNCKLKIYLELKN